jgi:diguanylate cyclase (GGDEF)-like protein
VGLDRDPVLAVDVLPERAVRRGPGNEAPVDASAPSNRRALFVVFGASIAGLIVLLVATGEGPVNELVYLTALVASAAVAFLGASRQPEGRRLGWLLVATSLALTAAADVLYVVVADVRGFEPDVSLADPVWLSSYLALGAGVLVLITRSPSWRGTDRVLELAAPITVCLLLVWQLAVAPTISDESLDVGVRLIWSVYPVLDALLLAVVVQAMVQGQARSATGLLVAGGLLSWLVADLVYATPGLPDGGVLLDVAWMVGPACIAVACWPVRLSPRSVPPEDELRLGRRMALASLLPLLVPGLVELWGYLEGEDPNPYPLLLATAVLVLLAFVRIDRLLRREADQRRALASSERYYRALSAESSDAVLVLDQHGRLVAPERNPGSPAAAWALRAGDDPLDFVLEEDRAVAEAIVERALRQPGEVVAGEVRVCHSDAGERWLVARTVNLLHDPDVEGVVVNLHDVTERKGMERELQRQALHDGLTGLPNRTLLLDRVGHLIQRNARTGGRAAVLVVGLDGFKAVNDTLGHEVGDEVLRQVGQRLVDCVREGDTVARLGGDEFALLVEGGDDPLGQAATLAERALRGLAEPARVPGGQVSLSASVGVELTNDEASAGSLLRNADLAMHRAKARGSGHWVRYEPAMHVAAVERLQVETALSYALRAGELRLVHQPVVSLATGRLAGFESLLRWQHPELGEVSPERFIPIAEETGLIGPIGRWVLLQACAEAQRWHELADGRPVTVAVNVSGCQLAAGDLVEDVVHALGQSGLSARALVVEVTETALVEDAERARVQLERLRRLGVRIAIDDFGTGWSSLSYLRQLPVDVLKVDRSFVAAIEDDRSTPAILRGLLDLGRTLGLEVVAEGVERPEQHQRLVDEHCERAQGFLYSRALEADAARDLVRRGDVEVAGLQGGDRTGAA